jgi:hypothetical protein
MSQVGWDSLEFKVNHKTTTDIWSPLFSRLYRSPSNQVKGNSVSKSWCDLIITDRLGSE